MPPIEFTFTPTVRDYARAAREYELKRIGMARLALLAVGVSAFYAGVLFLGMDFEPRWLLWIPIAVITLYLLSIFVVAPNRVRRQVEWDDMLTATTTWQVNEGEVETRSVYRQLSLRLGDFYRMVETPHYFLLFYWNPKRLFQLIPKQGFTSPEQQSAFRETVLRRVYPLPIPPRQRRIRLAVMAASALVVAFSSTYIFLEIVGIENTALGPWLAPQYFYPGQPARWDEICNYAQKRKSVALEGYLFVPENVHCDRNSCTVLLEKQPYGEWIEIDIRVDEGVFASEIRPIQGDHMADLPDEFDYEDFVMISHFGEPLYMGDRVRVSGFVSWGEDSCVLEASYIEASR